MIQTPMEILSMHPIRKSKKQKAAFREDVKGYLQSLGYPVTEEKGSFGCRNLVIGDPVRAKYLVTAHYDTPAAMPVPNLITPCNLFTFLLYQLFVMCLICVPTFFVGLLTGFLSESPVLASTAAYLFVWLLISLMMFGPANRSNANDNTSGVVTLLEIARTMPEKGREDVCFVLFDLEEAGLIGSASYRKAHKQESEAQVVLNLDCVGDGDHIVFFPGKKARKHDALCASLRNLTGVYGSKNVALREKGFAYYPSDQANFPLGIGIAAMHRKKGVGMWLGRIHTKKDTVLDETNVNLLRAALTSLIMACDKL